MDMLLTVVMFGFIGFIGCIIAGLAWVFYQMFFVPQPPSPMQVIINEMEHDLAERVMRRDYTPSRPRPKKRDKVEHAAEVLERAREKASRKYAEALLKGEPSDQHRHAFERDWSNAKEAVRAKYGKNTLEFALLELNLYDERM